MLEAWFTFFWRVLEVMLGIGLVIFVHELGHFLVAKKVGIRVEVFSLGFGPAIVGVKRGDTEYRISWIPLGGYVKMAGENPDEPASGAADEFASKPVGARAAVIVAGVCMNAIFAVFGFLVAFKYGVKMEAPAVGQVQPGSAAEAAGLRYGDRILRIGSAEPLEFMDIALTAAYASGPLDFTIERRGEQKRISVEPRRAEGSPVQQLGFQHMDAVGKVEKGSAAEAAHIREGDWILGVNGKPIEAFEEFIAAVRESPGKPLPVEVRHEDDTYQTVTITPTPRQARTYGFTLSPLPMVDGVIPESPAAAAGLKSGDTILEIASATADVRTLSTRVGELATANPGTPISLKIRRAVGGAPGVTETPVIALVPRRDEASGQYRLGIKLGVGIVGDVAPASPAAAAGIAPGDRVILVKGKLFRNVDHFDRLANFPEMDKTPLKLTVVKDGAEGSTKSDQVSLTPVEVPGRTLGEAGIQPDYAFFMKRAAGIVEPVKLGFDRTYTFAEQVFLTFRGMFSSRIDPTTLGGPIGIAETAYRVSEYGFGKFLYFLAIISVNLAILNIFPIPILDGGHLVFLAIEKVKGTPVRPEVQAAAQWVGLAILLGLMIYVTKNDLTRVFFPGN